MFIKKTLLLLSCAGSLVAAESHQNPGDIASKNHPQAFLATKVAGGTVGVFGGFGVLVGFAALDGGTDLLLASGKTSRLGRLIRILMIPPILYGGWKGGQAVSKATWDSTWNGVDKIQKFKASSNEKI